jgi:hypothetical protein
MNPINRQATSRPSRDATAVPDGFVVVISENGLKCIVPEFLVPATNDAFDGYRTRLAMDIRKNLGGVSVISCRPGGCRWTPGNSYIAEADGMNPGGIQAQMPFPLTDRFLQSVNERGYSFVRLGESKMIFPADPVGTVSRSLMGS